MSEDIKAAICSAVKQVTAAWKQAKRTAGRSDRVSSSRLYRMRYIPSDRVTIREVAFEVMENAYNKASANGRFYANARQIMYAARPAILAKCTAEEFSDVYFTQTLLKDYIEQNDPDWKVVWDARGHLIEAHTHKSIGLGGAAVTQYLEDWHADIELESPEIHARIDTDGPGNRYGTALFIEKEGFTEILIAAGIDTRYDTAIMSTKGLPVKAACDLIEALHDDGVRVLVLHDFDYAGFKIARTLREGTRLAQGTPVIDLGLRLADVEGLQAEPVSYGSWVDPKLYLTCDCDATDEEAAFLVSGGTHNRWTGQRVEINAMTSDQLISWIERKFAEHGVKKLIPDTEALTKAYQRAMFLKRIQKLVEQIEQKTRDQPVDVPDHLLLNVVEILERDPQKSWDEAVWELAEADDDEEAA